MAKSKDSLLISAALIIILSVSIPSFLANSFLLSFNNYSGFSTTPPSSNIKLNSPNYSAEYQSSPDIAIIILGGILLLAAFIMVWLRDRFVTSIKEMLLILSLTLLASFAYGLLISLLHPPSFLLFFNNQVYLIFGLAIILLLALTYIQRKRLVVKSSPKILDKEDIGETFDIKEDVFNLVLNEKDEIRKKIYGCYLEFCKSTEKYVKNTTKAMTPREYLDTVKINHPAIYSEANLITYIFEEARYSMKKISIFNVEKAIDALDSLKMKLKSYAGPG